MTRILPTMLCLTALCALLVALPTAEGQEAEKKPAAEKKAAPEKPKLKSVTAEAPAADAAPAKPAKPAKPGQEEAADDAPAEEYSPLTELKKEIARLKAELHETLKKHPKDSPQAVQLREELAEAERNYKLMAKAIKASDPGQADRERSLNQLYRTPKLQSIDASLDGGDPASIAEQGRRLAVAGLELQLQSAAREFHSTDDEATRKELKQKLHKLAETVVDQRRQSRKRAIARLEERLAELRKAEKEESVETIVERLVTGKPADPKDKQPVADPVAAPAPTEKP